jgi:hypothetical protein
VLPIVQRSSLFDPVSVMHKLSQQLRKFLWQGGKGNATKFQLVNLAILRAPKEHCEIGIKDPSLMNLALGAKFLWRLISSQNSWWKRILPKNCFPSEKKRCLKSLQEIKNGPSIWKLIKEAIPLMRYKLS